MAKQLNVNLAFQADTSQAKQAIMDLQSSLSKVATMNTSAPGIDANKIKAASSAAKELSIHLNSAFNANTGKLDLSKLNQSLKTSGTNVTALSSKLLQAGAQGEQAFVKLAQSIAAADRPLVTLGSKMSGFLTVLKNTARWQISSSILHGFIGAIQSAYGYAQDLNESLNNIRIVTGQTTTQMTKFAEEANKAAKALSTTTTEYTNASLIYYQQGLNDEEVSKRTEVTIKMANAAGQSAETVSDQMTAVWNNFYDGSKSLESYADAMTALGAATASSTSEISQGLEKFASVAETVGLSYEYATAALATVTATTRQSADVVGTAFKTLFARLNDLKLGETLDDGTTLGQYTENLAKVGVNIKDASGQLKNMDVILEETAAKWQNLDKDQQVALAKGVAGIRQYNQFIALMDNWDFMEKNLQTVENSEGTLQHQANIYAESWEGARDRVTASMESIYSDLIDDSFFIDISNGFASLLNSIGGFIDGIGGVKTVLIGIGSIILSSIANKIQPALSNLKHNFMVVFQSAEQQAQALAKEMNTSIRDALLHSKENGFSDSSIAALKNAEALNNAKAKLQVVEKDLSAIEKQRYEQELSILQAAQDEAQTIADNITKRKEEIELLRTAVDYESATKDLDSTRGKEEEFLHTRKAAAEAGNPIVEGDTTSKLTEQILAHSAATDTLRNSREQYVAALYDSYTREMEVSNGSIESSTKTYSLFELLQDSAQHYVTTIEQIGNSKQGFEVQIEKLKSIKSELDLIVGDSCPSLSKALSKALEAKTPTQLRHALEKVTKEMKKANIPAKDLEKILKKFGQTKNVNKLKNAYKDLGKDLTDLEKKQQRVNEIVNQFNPKHVASGIELISRSAAGLGQVAMAAQSARSIFQAWNNDDLSIGEKITTSLMSISMFVPSVIGAFKSLKKVGVDYVTFAETAFLAAAQKQAIAHGENIKNLTAEQVAQKLKISTDQAELILIQAKTADIIKNTLAKEGNLAALTAEQIAEKTGMTLDQASIVISKLKSGANLTEALSEAGLTTAKGAGTVATIAATIANWGFLASMPPLLAITLVIVAAFAALALIIWGVVAAVKAFQANSLEGKLAASEAVAKELAASLEQARQAAEDLKSAFDNYDTVVENLEKCTKGTQEWNEALNAVNSSVLELLKEYPELATMVNTDEDSEDFGESAISYGDSGEMVIADWARQELTKKANNYVSVAQAASIQGNQQVRADKITLQESNFKSDLESSANMDNENADEIANFIAENAKELSMMTTEEQKKFIQDYMDQNNFNKYVVGEGSEYSYLAEDSAENWMKYLSELEDDFGELTQAIDENTLATKTENRTIAASALSDNEAIQSSTLSTDIINASGGLYEDLTNEAMTELAGWGKDNINKAPTENDKDAQKVWEEYLEAAGIKADDAKLTGVTGTDDNRAFVYEDAEGNEKTVSLDAMKQTKAAYDAMAKLDEAAQGLATQFEVLATSATASDRALQHFLANQNFFQSTGEEVDSMLAASSGEDGAEKYLDKMIGDGDGDLTDKTAQKYGFEDAAQMIKVFEEQLEEVDKQWGKVKESIPEGLKGIENISLESAQALAEDYKLLADGPEGQDAVDALTEKIDLLKGSMTDDQIPEFMEQIGNVDWTKWNALDDVQAILDGMDISLELTGAEWEAFAEKMRNAAGATPAEEFDKIKNNLTGLGSAINGINPGESIDKTQYESLIALNEDLADSFIQTADGFKYIGTEEINVDDLKLKDELEAMNEASSTFNNAKDAYENSSINKMANSAFDNTDYAAQAEKLESEIDDKYAQKEKELGKGAGGGWYGEDDKAKAEEYKEGLEEEVAAKKKQQEAADTKNKQLKDDLKAMAGEIQNDENLMEVAKAMGYNEEQIKSMVDNEEYEKLQTLAKNVDKYMQEGLAGKYDSTELQEKMAATATNVSELNQMMFDGLITDTEIYSKQLTALTMDAITNATTLEELNNAIAIGGDYSYDMVADALLRIGEQYDNCSQEMAEFENALLTGNEEVIQSAQESLEVAIMLGEAAEEYGVSAEEMEIQASQLAKQYGISDKAAAKLAIQNQRMNKGIASLAENWKDWSKELKKADKTTTDYAKAAAETTKAVADLVGASEDLELPPEFLESDENLELIGKAAEGDTQAIQELGMAVAKTQVEMMKLDADITQKLADGTSKTITMEQFNSAKEQVLKGIEELQQKVADGSIAVGDEVSSMGTDWVNSLNEMAMATNMSVEDMNALLSELGVQTEVKTEEVTMKRKVPKYKTKTEITAWDEKSGMATEYTTSTAQDGYAEMDETVEVAQIGAEGEVDPPKVTYSGRGSASQSAVESGSSGSSSKTKDSRKKKTDMVDRYKEVNDELEETNRLMEKNSTLTEGMWGADKIAKMKESVSLMKQENETLKKKIGLAKQYLTEDKADLQSAAAAAGVGFTFNEDGNITNYTDQMTALYERRESLLNSFGEEMDEDQQKILDALDEQIDDLTSAYEQYETTLDEVKDWEQEQLEKELAIQQKNFDILNEELEVKLSINETDMARIDYYLNKIADDFYQMAEAAALMVGDLSKGVFGGQMGNYISNLEAQEKYMNDLETQFKNGDINQAQYIEGLQNSQSAIIDNLNSINELDKTMLNYYGDTLAAAGEELAKYTDRMEHQSSVLEHYSNIMEIMGKSKDYEKMGIILKSQATAAEDQMKVAKSNYEMYAEQEKARKKELDDAIARGASEAEIEVLKKNWEAASDAADEAQEEMLSKTEAWAEAMRAAVENELNGLAQTLENALTADFGGSFDSLATQMEHANSLQEEYLTTTNKIYETNKMMRTAQQEIDKSTNSVAKKKLKSFINETEQLQNQTKLSKYELEIQQAKYDLLLAEIALEEAQGVKSTVRLQRDSEGNFGYVYTADQNAIAEAEQKFADAQNSLYNIGLEGANQYTEKYQQTLSEFYNTMTELQMQYLNGEFENEQEYQAAMEEAKSFYYTKLQEYSELYTVAIGTDARVVQDAWSTEFQTMTYGTEKWKTSIETYIGNVNTAFGTWETVTNRLAEETVGKDLETLKGKVTGITDESKLLVSQITGENGVINALGAEADAVATTTGKYASMREEIQNLRIEYEKLLKQLNTNINNEYSGNSIGGTGDGSSDGSGDFDGSGSGSGSGGGSLNIGDSVTVKSSATTFSRDGGNGIQMQSWVPGSSFSVYGSDDDEVLIGDPGRSGVYTGWVRKTDLVGFATGGYTGEWGSYGKLAMLHEKELVLNQKETENFLASMEFLDSIVKTIDLYSANAQYGGLLSTPTFGGHNSEPIEQNVHIEAHFPEATDRNEIIEAINTLSNQASQLVNRK